MAFQPKTTISLAQNNCRVFWPSALFEATHPSLLGLFFHPMVFQLTESSSAGSLSFLCVFLPYIGANPSKPSPKIEAIPTLVMALMILLFLPSFPFSATFLTLRERAIAQARLNRDHKPQSHGGMNGWQGFKAIISDPNAWLFMSIYASCKDPYH
jgi:hypothetical protein